MYMFFFPATLLAVLVFAGSARGVPFNENALRLTDEKEVSVQVHQFWTIHSSATVHTFFLLLLATV